MVLRNTDGRVTVARRKPHSNRFKRMRTMAASVPGRTPRYLDALWFRRARGAALGADERFDPPAPRKQTIFRRMLDHWRGDFHEGWPDPEKYFVYMRAQEARGTVRWAYRNLKRVWKAMRGAA